MDVRIEKLTADKKVDFYKIHSGDDNWCNCVAWWVPAHGWGQTLRKPEIAEQLLIKLIRWHLLYVDNIPAG
jgi:hypothetical protein